MKSFQAGIVALIVALLMPMTTDSVWAAEGRGQDARQDGNHAVERSERGAERRDQRRVQQAPRNVERRDQRKFEPAPRNVERRDQRKFEPAPRNVERRDQRKFEPAPRNVERRDQRKFEPAPRNVERRDQRKFEPAPRTIERRDQRRVERAPRTVERRDGRREVREVRRDREHGWRKGYVLDRRYGHNHYYPPRGHVVRSLPRGYRSYHYHGNRYYYMHGIWYRHSGVSFIVVTPPFGIIVPVLPPYYTTVWVGGYPYYYAGGVYYVWRPAMQGYVVTEAPAESSVETEQEESGQFYVYPKEGQDPEQQAQDRYECHRWAADQTGFDPSQPPGDATASELVAGRSEYRRAIMACLEARGYSVK